MTERLKFYEDEHRYFLDGREIGSVTTILADVGLKNTDFGPDGEWHGRRGSMVHKACHLLDQGILDWSTVDERILGYVKAWESYKAEAQPLDIKSELPVFSEVYWYAGTVDKIITAPFSDTPIVLDIKSGAPTKADALQTAGYVMALFPDRYPYIDRGAIYLNDEGGWELELHVDLNDFNIFQAATVVYNHKGKIQ